MKEFTELNGEVLRGLDPAVVTEMAKKLGVSSEVAAEEIKRIGQALLDQELDGGSTIRLTGRQARRARERAERKRGLQ